MYVCYFPESLLDGVCDMTTPDYCGLTVSCDVCNWQTLAYDWLWMNATYSPYYGDGMCIQSNLATDQFDLEFVFTPEK